MSEHPHRVVVLRLSLQGSVLVVVVALLLWGDPHLWQPGRSHREALPLSANRLRPPQ